LSFIEGDKGLVAKSVASHHAISAPFKKSIDFKQQPLVVQYEVKYQKGGNCGGGYLKLLEDGFQTSGKEFSNTTPWVVMFGPDMTCPGSKVHFIFRHKSPIGTTYEEKHLSNAPKPDFGKNSNLFTLVINPDSTYEVFVNGKSENKGDFLEDFTPPVNPPKEIDDPEDKKPEDWVDEAQIPDPEATKPEDWDEDAPYEILDEEATKPEGWLDNEPLTVEDPDATKPDEWDDDEDGDWIAPTVPNPKCADAPGCGEWKRPYKANPDYKGKWYAPYIDNPAYKGVWAPRKIENPAYFADLTPVKSLERIGGVGIELWTMTEDILFDNIYVGHSIEDANKLAEETYYVKKPLEEAAAKAAEAAEAAADEDESTVALKDDPVAFIRGKVFNFVEAAKVDPLAAFKTHPETGAALVVVLATLFGMLGGLFGLVGSQQKPITKSTKKAETPKSTAAAPVPEKTAEKEENGGTQKRAGK
jgi:hypothetical protein